MDSSKDGVWRFVPFFGGGGSESGVSSEAFDVLSTEVDVEAGGFFLDETGLTADEALEEDSEEGGEGVKEDLTSEEDSTSAEDDNV